jgi:phosphoserine phosphatase
MSMGTSVRLVVRMWIINQGFSETLVKLTVEKICATLGISPQQAIVIGDGANDLHMMHIAGLSVAFRAKPVVRAQASIALNFVGLDGLLNLFS